MDNLHIRAERRNGMCVLRIAGELDELTTDTFTAHAGAAVRAVPGPVAVDLTGLTFVDVAGARALTQLIRGLPASRLEHVTECTPAVRRVLRLLHLPSPGYWTARHRTIANPVTRGLAGQVEQAVLHASEAQLAASGALARLQDTCIRLASTRERAGLTRERAQETVGRTRAAREFAARSRGPAA